MRRRKVIWMLTSSGREPSLPYSNYAGSKQRARITGWECKNNNRVIGRKIWKSWDKEERRGAAWKRCY